MDIEFTWDRGKAKRNLQKHGISFETAKQVFFDPHLVVVEDCEVDDEMRYQAIGYAGSDLLLVVHVDHSAQLDFIQFQTAATSVRQVLAAVQGFFSC